MPPFNPRLWNILPAALLLASACQTASSIPVAETETEAGDGDSNGDGDGDPTGDGDPSGDGDGDPNDDDTAGGCGGGCDPGYFCEFGNCYPENPCWGDIDCDPGERCEFSYAEHCEPLAPTPECEAPELIEIPLPDEAQGMTLDLKFADLDGDGHDELLLLRPGELLVIHDDSTFSSAAVNPLSEELAVVDADDNAKLDVILSSARTDHGERLLGVGDGSFASAVSLVMPPLTQPHAIDLPGDSPPQLVSRRGERGRRHPAVGRRHVSQLPRADRRRAPHPRDRRAAGL